MKRIFMLLLLCLPFLSHHLAAKEEVEVLYFHGKQRCATCMAIEKNARNAVNTQLASEVKSGKVVFRTIDISQEENQELAEKYQITWSSLFVVRHDNGKETAKNLTPYAFKQARKDPEGFKKGLVQTVKDLLK